MQYNSLLQCLTGPELPNGLSSSTMAQSPDGNGVILFGGWLENSVQTLITGTTSIRPITLK